MSNLVLSALTSKTSDEYYDYSLNPWGIEFYYFDDLFIDLNATQTSLGSRNLYYDSSLNGIYFWDSSGTAVGTSRKEFFKVAKASDLTVFGGPGHDNFEITASTARSLDGGDQTLTIADFDLEDTVEIGFSTGYDNADARTKINIADTIQRTYSSIDNFTTFIIPNGTEDTYSTLRLLGDIEIDYVSLIREWPTLFFRTASGSTPSEPVVPPTDPAITPPSAEQSILVSSSAESVDEGQTVTFSIEKTSSLGSSLIAYTLEGVGSEDVLGGSLSGSVQLDALGQGSLSVTLVQDQLIEGPEQLSFVLENGVRSSVTVRDFVQTQSIDSVSYENGSHLSEGFGNGVVVNYTSNDTTIRSLTFDLLADGATEPQGSVTLQTDVNGSASGLLRLENDVFPEPNQTYVVQLADNPQVFKYVQFRDDDSGNAISGGSGSEVLTTSDDDDVVDAGIGDDFVIASRGNDFIDGGAGQDAVEYQGSTSSEISLRKDGDAVVVSLSGKSDRLLDVERLHFEDQWVALDMNGNAGNAAKMIVAAFGSELLDTYLGTGIGLADDGLSMSDLANLVVNTGLMPYSNSIQFVDLVFNNLLERDANALEKNLYSGYLNDGLYTEADLLVMAANTQMSNAYMLDFAIDNVGLPYLDTLV